MTFLSLAVKISSLYAAACMAAWCLPPQNMSGINLLLKQIPETKPASQHRLPVATVLLPGLRLPLAWDSVCFFAYKNICLSPVKAALE